MSKIIIFPKRPRRIRKITKDRKAVIIPLFPRKNERIFFDKIIRNLRKYSLQEHVKDLAQHIKQAQQIRRLDQHTIGNPDILFSITMLKAVFGEAYANEKDRETIDNLFNKINPEIIRGIKKQLEAIEEIKRVIEIVKKKYETARQKILRLANTNLSEIEAQEIAYGLNHYLFRYPQLLYDKHATEAIKKLYAVLLLKSIFDKDALDYLIIDIYDKLEEVFGNSENEELKEIALSFFLNNSNTNTKEIARNLRREIISVKNYTEEDNTKTKQINLEFFEEVIEDPKNVFSPDTASLILYIINNYLEEGEEIKLKQYLKKYLQMISQNRRNANVVYLRERQIR